MKTNSIKPTRTSVFSVALAFAIGSGMLLAQDQTAGPPPDQAPPPDVQQQTSPANNNGGWRRVDQAPPVDASQPPAGEPNSAGPPPGDPRPRATMDPNYSPGPGQAPDGNQDPNQPRRYPNGRYPNPYPPAANRGPIPAKLTIQPGTYITVRLNQGLSSDRNQTGDGFAATLAKPVVVDGIVVAERGQTVGGRVVEAKKAGRVEGVSHLAVQLTDLTLSDGHPVPIQTKLFNKNGPTSQGRDAAAIGATTATGAAIGAAAGWGTGAAIGAGAGAVVGIVGVLVTRGHPTYLYPEQILTFRVEAPATISTEATAQAFRWVSPNDYDRPYDMQARTGPPNGYYQGPGYASPYPYAYGYPYYWGPGVGLYFGGGYWGRGYWGRGYWGRGWRR
jgi:hypothetical protein